MRSVADALRAAQRRSDASRSFGDLVRQALSLGERDARLLAATRGIPLHDARRVLSQQRQRGRLRSPCHESLLT